jgi:hypothetical protein
MAIDSAGFKELTYFPHSYEDHRWRSQSDKNAVSILHSVHCLLVLYRCGCRRLCLNSTQLFTFTHAHVLATQFEHKIPHLLSVCSYSSCSKSRHRRIAYMFCDLLILIGLSQEVQYTCIVSGMGYATSEPTAAPKLPDVVACVSGQQASSVAKHKFRTHMLRSVCLFAYA